VEEDRCLPTEAAVVEEEVEVVAEQDFVLTPVSATQFLLPQKAQQGSQGK
jgi:hypothetical protein